MFSKAPKRKGNLTGTGNGKRINNNHLTQTRFVSKKRSDGMYAYRLSSPIQPVIFVTIDHTLADAAHNSSISAKAEAAKKTFSAYKS